LGQRAQRPLRSRGTQAGTILHFDGRGWRPIETGTSIKFHAIHGNSATDVFVLGYQGTTGSYEYYSAHFDGTSWTANPIPDSDDLDKIWTSGPSDAYAISQHQVMHYDGTSWSKSFDLKWPKMVYDIWGSGPADVYLVGTDGTGYPKPMILHFDGKQWNSTNTFPVKQPLTIWGSSSTDVFVGGDAGIAHFDGAARWPRSLASGGRQLQEGRELA